MKAQMWPKVLVVLKLKRSSEVKFIRNSFTFTHSTPHTHIQDKETCCRYRNTEGDAQWNGSKLPLRFQADTESQEWNAPTYNFLKRTSPKHTEKIHVLSVLWGYFPLCFCSRVQKFKSVIENGKMRLRLWSKVLQFLVLSFTDALRLICDGKSGFIQLGYCHVMGNRYVNQWKHQNLYTRTDFFSVGSSCLKSSAVLERSQMVYVQYQRWRSQWSTSTNKHTAGGVMHSGGSCLFSCQS